MKQGQYYLEYLKFSCDPTCNECEEEGWTGDIPITRSPLPLHDLHKHADGSVARTFDEDIEDDDENMPSSSHDDTSSDPEEESIEYEGGSSGNDYAERSFQVLFIDDADILEVV